MAASQTRVLCVGHSYIKYFQRFVYGRGVSHLFVNDINPSLDRFPGPLHNLFLAEDEFAISFDGVGDATIYPPPEGSDRKNKCIGTLFNNSVDFFDPHIVYIQIGSNDLSDPQISPTVLATDIISYADYVLNTLHVPFVIIGELVPRVDHRIDSDFNFRISTCNKELKRRLVIQRGRHREQTSPQLLLAPHEGLRCCQANMYKEDGVHLSDLGNARLLRSVRGALIRAKKQCMQIGIF